MRTTDERLILRWLGTCEHMLRCKWVIWCAEKLLASAGIRTVMGAAWEACLHGADGLKGFCRDRFGELAAEDLELLGELAFDMPKSRNGEWGAASPVHPDACISACK